MEPRHPVRQQPVSRGILPGPGPAVGKLRRHVVPSPVDSLPPLVRGQHTRGQRLAEAVGLAVEHNIETLRVVDGVVCKKPALFLKSSYVCPEACLGKMIMIGTKLLPKRRTDQFERPRLQVPDEV